MTKATTAQALRAGPLEGQDLSLLKAGSSVLRGNLSGFTYTLARQTAGGLDLTRIPDGFHLAAVQKDRLNYIGERSEDGMFSDGSPAIIAFRLAPAQQDSQQGAGEGRLAAIRRGLHRWLQWDFPDAQTEYAEGVMHIDNAIRDAFDAVSRHPSGHTGGPVACVPVEPTAEMLKAAHQVDAAFDNQGKVANALTIYRTMVAAAPPTPPAARGSGGGEAVARAARKVSNWIKCGMPDQSGNTPTREALKRDLETILSALQSAHPESGDVRPDEDQITAWARGLFEANRFYNHSDPEALDWVEMAAPDGGIRDLHMDMARAAKKVWEEADAHPASGAEDVGDRETFTQLYREAREWSGSAWIAGEKVGKAEEHRLKGEMYSWLCRLGNVMDHHADRALPPQDGAVAGEGVGDG